MSSGPVIPGTGASWGWWMVWTSCLITWVPLKVFGVLDVSWWWIIGILFLWLAGLMPERYEYKAD